MVKRNLAHYQRDAAKSEKNMKRGETGELEGGQFWPKRGRVTRHVIHERAQLYLAYLCGLAERKFVR